MTLCNTIGVSQSQTDSATNETRERQRCDTAVHTKKWRTRIRIDGQRASGDGGFGELSRVITLVPMTLFGTISSS
jgi:hypothetical protein